MRRSNDHFYLDGENVVETSNGEVIPLDEEPVFLLRARDPLAFSALYAYYDALCVDDGCTDYHMQSLNEQIEKFERFATEQADRMKQSGITRGR